jgi:DNA-binding HxlR family transcriptional regulator
VESVDRAQPDVWRRHLLGDRNGVPSMSRSMLIKRLDELQRAEVIETQLKPDGRGYNYRLTDAGAVVEYAA